MALVLHFIHELFVTKPRCSDGKQINFSRVLIEDVSERSGARSTKPLTICGPSHVFAIWLEVLILGATLPSPMDIVEPNYVFSTGGFERFDPTIVLNFFQQPFAVNQVFTRFHTRTNLPTLLDLEPFLDQIEHEVTPCSWWVLLLRSTPRSQILSCS